LHCAAQLDPYAGHVFNHRIQILSFSRVPEAEFGARGGEPGQFRRPEAIAVDELGGLAVVDADNNRVQRYVPTAGF
jgi:hypothetical protein